MEFNDKNSRYYWHDEDRKFIDVMPEIRLPEGWGFQPLPPFSGAVQRFRILTKIKSYSVYLDCYNLLSVFSLEDKGFVPHWEVLLDADESSVERAHIEDFETIIIAIKEHEAQMIKRNESINRC